MDSCDDAGVAGQPCPPRAKYDPSLNVARVESRVAALLSPFETAGAAASPFYAREKRTISLTSSSVVLRPLQLPQSSQTCDLTYICGASLCSDGGRSPVLRTEGWSIIWWRKEECVRQPKGPTETKSDNLVKGGYRLEPTGCFANLHLVR